MLADASPEVLLAFAERDEHRYDGVLWRALLEILPARSPRRASVVAHLERIEAALA
jgi:cytochrome c-type biogenesis protein CcmH/NrfG